MEGRFIWMTEKKPEIIVFAGPNGSGKSTITSFAKIIPPYINSDDIKRTNVCSDIEAADIAEKLRNNMVDNNTSFTFETVLSTRRNLDLLIRAKEQGFFIRVIYVLTRNPKINATRVKIRFENGGHDVPVDKVYSRYERALKLLPELIEVSDVCHIYDNSDTPFRIFKKRKNSYFYWESDYWTKNKISELTGVKLD